MAEMTAEDVLGQMTERFGPLPVTSDGSGYLKPQVEAALTALAGNLAALQNWGDDAEVRMGALEAENAALVARVAVLESERDSVVSEMSVLREESMAALAEARTIVEGIVGSA